MSYLKEFGTEYQIPAKIIELVEKKKLTDMSWHNDVSPSFGTFFADPVKGEVEIRIWIDHPEKEKREFDCDRFTVTDDTEVVWEGADINEAIKAYGEIGGF